MLTGGADPIEATGAPPEGFVKLAPAARQAPDDHRRGVSPGAGVVSSLLLAVGAALASLQTLNPWVLSRAVMQAAGVLIMFGGLGIWARLTRHAMPAIQPCACERPQVWIRVIPSVVQNRHPLGESLDGAGACRSDRQVALVEANGVRRS